MKYFYILFFLLQLPSSLSAQTYGNDSLIFSNESFLPGDIIVLDTFKTDVNNWRITILYPFVEKLYALTQLLKRRQELNIDIVVLMNTNYDTTSANWMRLKSRNIIEDLIYFDINPLRFQVKDSLDKKLDKDFDSEEAFRKIILRVNTPTKYRQTLAQLEEVFDSEEKNYKSFFTNHSSLAENNNTYIPITLDSFEIPQLIDSFHDKFFKLDTRTSFSLIPEKYPIKLGRFQKLIFEESTFEHYHMPQSISINSRVESSFLISHKTKSRFKNQIFLNEKLRRSIEAFLAYEFKYDLDTFSNWPSNIIPINETKEKLNDIKPYFNPRIDIAFKGACNGHNFWEFHWELQSPFTANKISIDRKDKKAFVFYKNEYLENLVAIYELKDNTTWKYLDKIKLDNYSLNDEPKTRFLNFVLLFCALFSFGILFLRKRKTTSV